MGLNWILWGAAPAAVALPEVGVASCEILYAMDKTAVEDLPDPGARPGFLRLAEFTRAFLGTDTRADKSRVVRMADRGELAAIRIGRRGDRLFPASEVDRLLREAHTARKEVAQLEGNTLKTQ